MPFEFTVGEEPLTAGEPLTVQCGVSEGDMPITFRWTFHGQELSSQMGIATMRINSRVSLLSIDSIAAGHAGDYTCTAQNSAGQVNHTAVLLVQGFHFFGFSLAFFLSDLRPNPDLTWPSSSSQQHLGSLHSATTTVFYDSDPSISL